MSLITDPTRTLAQMAADKHPPAPAPDTCEVCGCKTIVDPEHFEFSYLSFECEQGYYLAPDHQWKRDDSHDTRCNQAASIAIAERAAAVALRARVGELERKLDRYTNRHAPYSDEIVKEIEALENKYNNPDDDSELVELVSIQHFSKSMDRWEAERDALTAQVAEARAELNRKDEYISLERKALETLTSAAGLPVETPVTQTANRIANLVMSLATLTASLARVTEAAREWEKWLVYHGGMAALDDEGIYTKERCIEIFISMAESIRSTALAAPVDAPAEHKGFWVTTPDGSTMHVHGDPNMSEETLSALQHMMELAVKQYAAPTRGPKESE